MSRDLKRERSLSSLGVAKYNIENVLGDYTCQICYNTANLRRSLFSTCLGSVWCTLCIFENIFFRKNCACINHYLPLDELIPEKYVLQVYEEALWKKREQLGIAQRQGNNLNCPTCDNPFLFIGYCNLLCCRICTTGHHVKYQQRNIGKKIISTEMAFKKNRKPDNIAVTEQMQRFTDLTLTEPNSIDLYHILNGPLLYPLCYHLFKESIEKMLLKQQDALKTHDLMASTKIIDQSDVLIIKKDKEIDQSLRLVPYRLGIRLWYQFIKPQSKERMRESSKIVLKNSKNLLVGIDFKLGNQSAITITEKSDEDEVAQDLLKEEAKTQFHGLEQKSLHLSDLKNWNKDLLKNQ
ncbi:unnamed protein product [Moneuplotes crassus]|uniref:Uncharacterized protein n=1 Tax=Euplotes crassus TaxID=5936 RepID=A0AAD1UBE2_EUPCR|nr:unnamed protein product [Moneuplotes crassus]